MNNFSTVPQISIELDGSALTAEIIQTIQKIRVKQILSAPSLCEIILPETQQNFSSAIITKVGSYLQIKIDPFAQPLFYGQITAIDYCYDAALRPLLAIRAYDLLHQLRKRQPVRTHIQVNLRTLAQDLTKDLGLKVQGGDKTVSTPRLFQYRQSDLQLLHEFGENQGHYFFLNADRLLITTLEGTEDTEPLTLGKNLFEARLSINAETVTKSVTATGWNLQRTTSVSGKSDGSGIGADANAFFSPSDFASDGQRTLVDCSAQNESQAELIAQKEFDRCIMQQVTLWGVAAGNPALTPGLSVHVLGVASALEKRYVLTEVTHSIDPNKGFISEINSMPPAIGQPRPAKNSMIGVVSQVNDPDNLGRVKVSLPTYNNIETEWLEVLTPGAGKNKGQLVLPDVGDSVLLLIINGEPGQSIVLGGLYGEQDLPHSVVEDGAVKRFVMQTADKQRIFLDDSEVSIRIETQSGHFISMTPGEIGINRKNGSFVSIKDDRMVVHSETNLEIEAPGSSITFRGKKIDFEEA